jgi:hypothetical protein
MEFRSTYTSIDVLSALSSVRLAAGRCPTFSLRSSDSGSSLMVACYLQSVASTLVGEKNTKSTLGGREGLRIVGKELTCIALA